MVHCRFDRSHGCGFVLFAALGLRPIRRLVELGLMAKGK
jgi:hypothetical protein